VHITSGFSALAAALVIGQPSKNNTKQTAHSIPLVFVGTALIWFGWLVTRLNDFFLNQCFKLRFNITQLSGMASTVARH